MFVFCSDHEEQTAAPTLSLRLEVPTTNVCFNKAVQLLCHHPHVLASRMFSATRPSWKENGTVFALDDSMYRSVTQINETLLVLELVPKQSHFEPFGAHNYTCFLPCIGRGILESNLMLVRPQGMECTTQAPMSCSILGECTVLWGEPE